MPTMSLPPRQAQVLSLIRSSIEDKGYPPSLRELAAGLKVSGTRAIEKHVQALERKGFLRRRGGARSIELLGRPSGGRRVPILGRVAAGVPILAEEHREGELTLDPSLARWDDCYLLRVKGDSMTGAAILDGDLVLVRPQKDARDGEIVVAMLDGEATVKRLKRESGRAWLWPENPSFSRMELKDDESSGILGKVAGVFRF
ncbi:MAG: transcriptional repressor LexA [Elusimicrobia bacterium]|nr:transcriptional repressor LexA [Elusimicrobiota bacterium]